MRGTGDFPESEQLGVGLVVRVVLLDLELRVEHDYRHVEVVAEPAGTPREQLHQVHRYRRERLGRGRGVERGRAPRVDRQQERVVGRIQRLDRVEVRRQTVGRL